MELLVSNVELGKELKAIIEEIESEQNKEWCEYW